MFATEFLTDLIQRLEGRDLTYALVGSIAAMSYGEPRATLDIDVVIVLDTSHLEVIESLFPAPEFYLSVDAVKEAVESKSQFNVIHPASGMKVDFFVAGDTVEKSQIERRLRCRLLPRLNAWCSPPEELVVKKLLYYQQGASDKHLRDITSMLRISPSQIDLARLRLMTVEQGVGELWERVLQSVPEARTESPGS
ncbi:MAG: nucleotidyl transferase AbiEii/AbiGii toxin family protein [Gemmatimonadota bacterium]